MDRPLRVMVEGVRVILAQLPNQDKKEMAGCYSEGVIIINLDTDANPASTLHHEFLHHRHPRWSEKRVAREEQKWWRGLTTRQQLRMFRKFANLNWRSR